MSFRTCAYFPAYHLQEPIAATRYLDQAVSEARDRLAQGSKRREKLGRWLAMVSDERYMELIGPRGLDARIYRQVIEVTHPDGLDYIARSEQHEDVRQLLESMAVCFSDEGYLAVAPTSKARWVHDLAKHGASVEEVYHALQRTYNKPAFSWSEFELGQVAWYLRVPYNVP
jgi:hypothetical protein